MIKIGFHASIAGGVDKSVDRVRERRCDTFQIFTCNPRGWKYGPLKSEEARLFVEKLERYKISPAVAHMPYLPNLATPDEETYKKSCEILRVQLERCAQLSIPYLVTHLGSHLGRGVEFGFQRIIRALNNALSETSGNSTIILLENTAGAMNSMGSSFENIKHIIDGVKEGKRVAVCFDTCHAFASGYDLRTAEAIRTTLDRFDRVLGLENLKAIHLNDSKGDINSNLDRHEHIGLGHIGEKGFRALFKAEELQDHPFILETPIDARRDDRGNIEKVKELAE